MKIREIEVTNYKDVLENFKTSSNDMLMKYRGILVQIKKCEEVMPPVKTEEESIMQKEIKRRTYFVDETIAMIDEILKEREYMKV